MSTRIVIVDDHRIIREGLRSLLQHEDGIEVVGEAEDGEQAVQVVRELTPDIIVMDVAMPRLSGFEATRQILAENPQARIIALSMHSDRRFVAEMLRAGARGYLLKDSAFDHLMIAIHAVLAGKTYLGPGVAA